MGMAQLLPAARTEVYNANFGPTVHKPWLSILEQQEINNEARLMLRHLHRHSLNSQQSRQYAVKHLRRTSARYARCEDASQLDRRL